MVIPIYIGYEPKTWLASEVLRFSVERRTQADVSFHDLNFLKMAPVWGRFKVPELQEFKGRALFLAPYCLVLGDIAELFQAEMGGKGALAKPLGDGYQTHVILLNCDHLKHWDPDAWEKEVVGKPQLMRELTRGNPDSRTAGDFGPLPPEWSGASEESLIAVYSQGAHQPWKHPQQPRAAPFLAELKAALEEGALPREAIDKEIHEGRVHPDLWEYL